MTFDIRNLLGLAGVLMCFAFAVWLWRVGSRGSTARQLSLLLVIEGVTLGTSSALQFGVAYDPNAPPVLQILRSLLHHVGDVALIALYPPFLANALRTRWTLPFARPPVRIGLAFLAVALLAFVLGFGPEAYFRRVPLLYLAMCLTFIYAFVISLQAWRAATTESDRRRARAFMIGFGIRDVLWSILYGAMSYLSLTAWSHGPPPTFPDWVLFYPLGTLLEVPLIAYGILSTQLFDIDLKLKWTIRQSTLAAIVIATIYFATEAADRLLSDQLGAWPGLIAAALIVYFLAPLQRIAERVANHAMPQTTNTPEYLAYRKMQVYEAALTEALGGDGISQKERALLTRLRESLGVSADDARAMEDDLRARSVGAPAAAR